MDKFNNKYEIMTSEGWKNFDGVRKKTSSENLKLIFEDKTELICTSSHLLFSEKWIKAEDLEIGQFVSNKKLISKTKISEAIDVYDLLEVDGNEYLTNGLSSHNCAFEGSTDNLIDAYSLKKLEVHEPWKSTDYINQYVEPDEKREYMLVADVSRGKGLDYSAFSVIDITTIPYKQVCIYRNNNIIPTDYANVVYRLAKLYNNAYVLVENNDAGCQVVDILNLEYGYENLLFSETQNGRKVISGGFGRNAEGGIRTSSTVKNMGCATLKNIIENEKLIVNDSHTILELKNFVRVGDSYKAASGHHDDLAMTLVLFSWAIEQEYIQQLSSVDIKRALSEYEDDQLNNELMPFGFMDDGNDDNSNFISDHIY